ncbi:MAG TPA: T9SS type A sorting domain-containing protein, partial [Bacteroidetes bacterium]|nr:T9SS type A sorting domain-containing protein [Bacteroidota bacterium]
TFHGQPDPDFFPIGSSCIYDSLWLYNQTLGVGPQGFPYPDTKWMWSLPGGIPDTSNAQHPFVVYQDTGYYMITLTVMNSFGQCMYPVTVYISGPDLSVGSNVVNIGDSTGFFTFSGETGTWLWNFGDGSLDSIGHGPFPYHTYGSVGTYIYTATFLPDDTLQCVVNMRDTARVTSLPLAAGLLDFQGAYTEQQAVALNWRSLPDQGLDHFLLERSLNGSHFQQIAQIPGRAGSAGLLRYAYLDDGAPLRPSWYRLWPVDREGQLGEHALIAVAPPRALHLDFWPNPAQDNLHLAVFSPERELPIQLRICDVLGQNVLERQLLAGKGKQDFTLSLENLPAGVYLVRAWNPRSGKVLAQEKLLIH